MPDQNTLQLHKKEKRVGIINIHMHKQYSIKAVVRGQEGNIH